MMQRLMDVDVAAIVVSAVLAAALAVAVCGGGGGKRKRRSIQMSNGVPFPRLNFPISSATTVEGALPLPLPPQPPPTILQPQIPAAYTAPRLLPPPFFRAPSLLPPPPILPNVLSPPIVQTAPIVPPPKILQPDVSNPPTQVQLIPLAMCAMPCRKKLMSPAMTRNTCCNGDYCDIDCCSDDC
uniref:Uncharacterized protein n=1 Tax=Meloidogyne javanica TaxID=6303 RepID=A0A915LJA6_MELJA